MTATFSEICDAIYDMQRDLKRVIIAIDGMSGAGKTHLANRLRQCFPQSDIIHMDDFYLPKAERTDERMAEPGGHMDTERFTEEVATPIWKGLVPLYRKFDCKTQSYSPSVSCSKDATLCIVEGTYATHPNIPDVYDLRIFAEADQSICLDRIKERAASNKEVEMFETTWIPRETQYFESFMTKELADLVYDGGTQDIDQWTPPPAPTEKELLPFIHKEEE